MFGTDRCSLHLDLSPYWCRFHGCASVDTCGMPDEWVIDASSTDPDTRYNFSGYREQFRSSVSSCTDSACLAALLAGLAACFPCSQKARSSTYHCPSVFL